MWVCIESVPAPYFALSFMGGSTQVGHLHANGMPDLPLPKRLRSLLLAQGDVALHPYRAESGWATFHVNGRVDFEHAARLLRLAYLHRRLVKRDATFDITTLDAELDALEASDAVRAFLAPLADRLRVPPTRPALPA